MKRIKVTTGEKAALFISTIALLVSIWSIVESRKAAKQARWTEFRASALDTIEKHRRTYSNVTCLFYATNTTRGQEEFKRFKTHLDELESSLYLLQQADAAGLDNFESLLDKSNASFRKLDDGVAEVKSHLSIDQLNKVNAVCGN